MSTILSIVYQPVDQEYLPGQEDYLRVPVDEALLVAGHGIQGDQKAGHHPKRHLNLLTYEWLQSLASLGYYTGPGQFGEQLVIQGLAPESLKAGNVLQLGDQACIELTKPRTGCERLELAQGRSIAEIREGIGWLAKVITGGIIRVGDPVRVLTRAPVFAILIPE